MTGASAELQAWRDRAAWFDFEGHRIAWWSEGETGGTGRPLLLIHGFPTASWDWWKIWPDLARDRRLIACDMLGFGYSDKPAGGYSIHRQADLQVALLDHLGIGEFDMVVHDYGVSVAQEMLARHNEESALPGLGKVLFLNGGLFPDQHRALLMQKIGISPLGFIVSRMMSRDSLETSFRRIFGAATPPTSREMDDFWHLITHKGGNRIIHKLLGYIRDRRRHGDRWRAALTDTTRPLKLVDGGADPVSGAHLYHAFRERVPQGEAVLLPEIGHYPQVEAPVAVLAEIKSFLDEPKQ